VYPSACDLAIEQYFDNCPNDGVASPLLLFMKCDLQKKKNFFWKNEMLISPLYSA
jgi:hypothetical protein